MRINAADTGLQRFMINPDNYNKVSNRGNPLAPQRAGDALELSKIGERLRFQGEAIASWDAMVTDVQADQWLQLMDKTISDVGKTLEQMKSLAVMAQDERLSDADRLELQIEMARLQGTLSHDTKAMALKLAGKTDAEIESLAGSRYPAPDAVLTRALERARNGEAWDVGEKFIQETMLTEVVLLTESGQTRMPVAPGEQIELGPDVDPKAALVKIQTPVGEGYYEATDDPKAEKVSDYLKKNNIVNLMDSQSAAEGLERLESQIEGLKEMRASFAEFYNENKGEASAGEKKTSESDIDAMLGRFAQEQRQKSELIKEQRNARESGSALTKAPQGESEEEKPPRETIGTLLGTMVYAAGEDGTVDYANPKLENPDTPAGKFFARLDAFLKQNVFANFGLHAPTGRPTLDGSVLPSEKFIPVNLNMETRIVNDIVDNRVNPA